MRQERRQFWNNAEEMRRATIGSDDRAELRRSRLDEDLHLAADLINTTGLDLFGNGATAFDLPSMTISEQSSSALLKKSRLFTTQREQEKALRAKQMRAYMRDRRHSRTRDGLRFMSLRLTNEAGGVFDVDTLRSGSQKDYARLSSAIKDIKKKAGLAGIVRPLYISRHDILEDAANTILQHYHCGFDVIASELEDIQDELIAHFRSRGFDIYCPGIVEDGDDEDDAANQAAYDCPTLKTYEDLMEDDAMAEYHIQTAGEHFFNPQGDFRAFLGELNGAGLNIKSEYKAGGCAIEYEEKVPRASRSASDGNRFPRARALVLHKSDGLEVRPNLIVSDNNSADLNPEALAACNLDDDIKRARHQADQHLALFIRDELTPNQRSALLPLLKVNRETYVPSSIHLDVFKLSRVINVSLGYLPGIQAASEYASDDTEDSFQDTLKRHLDSIVDAAERRHRVVSHINAIRTGRDTPIEPAFGDSWRRSRMMDAARLLHDMKPRPQKLMLSPRHKVMLSLSR